MTAKQRVVLSALKDAQLAHNGLSVSAGQIAAGCADPWRDRRDLVTQALWLLHAQGLVLSDSGAARGWKITAAGRSALAPRRDPAPQRPALTSSRPASTRRRQRE